MWEVASEPEDPGGVPPGSLRPGEPLPTPRRTGRVKTRLLGFEHSNGTVETFVPADARSRLEPVRFAVGWLVVISGPGRGESFALRPGVSTIGRGEDQAVCLDFGDTAISREAHALIAYDEESRGFFIGHSGKANLVRLNGRPVLTTEPVAHGDRIRIGETTLMLVTLCGPGFSWAAGGAAEKGGQTR
jgi:hypothetical protein